MGKSKRSMKILKRGLALILSAVLAITGLSEMAVESKTDTIVWYTLIEDGNTHSVGDNVPETGGTYVYESPSVLFKSASLYYNDSTTALKNGDSIRSDGTLKMEYDLKDFTVLSDFSSTPSGESRYVLLTGKTYTLTEIPSNYKIASETSVTLKISETELVLLR